MPNKIHSCGWALVLPFIFLSPNQNSGIIGAGSSFVYPLFIKIFSVYHSKNNLQVNYQSIGSGGGIKQLMAKTVDFGDTDLPLTDQQERLAGSPIVHIPIALGATVISYNLPGKKINLKMNGKLLGDIFLGIIHRWNDKDIQKLNLGTELPNLPILVIHRSDGSGTTFMFTDYLTKVNSNWSTNEGAGSSISWPAGIGAKGNEGVAGLIQQIPGSIGYIEMIFALANKMPMALLQNKYGKFIFPTSESILISSEIQNFPKDTRVSITNSPNQDAYPISGFTWIILYQEQYYRKRSRLQAKSLVNLIDWVIHEGQSYYSSLNYIPISESHKKNAEAILKSITYQHKSLVL